MKVIEKNPVHSEDWVKLTTCVTTKEDYAVL